MKRSLQVMKFREKYTVVKIKPSVCHLVLLNSYLICFCGCCCCFFFKLSLKSLDLISSYNNTIINQYSNNNKSIGKNRNNIFRKKMQFLKNMAVLTRMPW